MHYEVFLSAPHMGGLEQRFVQEAFETNWIAPGGPSLQAFEAEMAEYAGTRGAIGVSSGTAAIHLALRWFGAGPGDTVFCSDLTFVASCSPILYQHARPVFIDSEPDSWNMSPRALEKALAWAKRAGRLPKAVIIVDLYGESADWDALLPICRDYGVPVLEDAAEAVGSSYHGRQCGSFGEVSIFSFNGNKILTTSGGGMVLSDNEEALDKMRFWATQSRESCLHYEHKETGYNYRLSNVCAAIGRGQLRFLAEKIAHRQAIHRAYRAAFQDAPAHIKPCAAFSGVSNGWMSTLVLDTDRITPERIVRGLQNAGIEARPAWKPMHQQPLFCDSPCFAHGDTAFVSDDVFRRSLCLPSGDGMSEAQQQRVIHAVQVLLEALHG